MFFLGHGVVLFSGYWQTKDAFSLRALTHIDARSENAPYDDIVTCQLCPRDVGRPILSCAMPEFFSAALIRDDETGRYYDYPKTG